MLAHKGSTSNVSLAHIMYEVGLIVSEYKVIGKKGEGTFSEVLKCQSIEDETTWACKRLKRHYKRFYLVNKLLSLCYLHHFSYLVIKFFSDVC